MEKRLRELGVYESFRHRLEYKKLSAMLPEKELLAAAGGIYKDRRWLWFLFDDSLQGVSAHPVTGIELAALMLEDIEELALKRGLLFSSLRFSRIGSEERIDNIAKKAAAYLYEQTLRLVNASV